MKLSNEKIIEILKNNFYILMLYEYFSENEITYHFVDENDIDIYIQTKDWETVLNIKINLNFYDEKFINVDKYEVANMGLEFVIWTGTEKNDELNMENIWKHLFFNKEKITFQK